MIAPALTTWALLTLKWVSASDEPDDAEWPCATCALPLTTDPRGNVYPVLVCTWRLVCLNCLAAAESSLFDQLWLIRAEIEWGVIGPQVWAWLATLEPTAARAAREGLQHRGIADGK